MKNHIPTAATRRQALALLATGAATLPAWAATPARPLVEVWKDPDCGCCKDWIAHMQRNGFAFRLHDNGNTGARARLGLPMRLGSCHTALVGGYLVEGHVPATDVQRLLKERPQALGLAVPGMPVGSPGMDGPAYQGRRDPFDVLLVTRGKQPGDVATRVFASYR